MTPVRRNPPVPPPLADPRRRRAEEEGPAYYWQPWHDGRWLCESRSGALYIVGADGCSCSDWHHRCGPIGARCKHQYALAHRLLSEGSALVYMGMALLEDPEDLEGREK